LTAAREDSPVPTAPVLVVDDHLDTCRLLVKLLQMIGRAAVCVESGDEALGYVRRVVPSLVILDVMMPEMSGFDVLKSMRADARLRDVPVVMHSARDDEMTRAIALRDGAQGYFVKSRLGFSELRAVVDQYVGRPN
jgi:DNA-binding response OmpR family regulator